MDNHRLEVFKYIFLFVVGIILVVVLYRFDPASSNIFPPCPFHKLTGFYCPGCGSLRAINRLLHGRFLEALGLNPLMIITLPFLVYGLVAQFCYSVFSYKIAMPFIKAVWIWGMLSIIILYWVARNIDVYPFNTLRP